MTNHTPTPWKAENGAVWSNPIGSNLICNCDKLGVKSIEASNAAFIVRACNSHDAMLEALRNCRIALTGERTPLLDRIDNAITLATKE